MADDEAWTEVRRADDVAARLDALEASHARALSLLEECLREVRSTHVCMRECLSHLRRQSLVHRASLPFGLTGDHVSRARHANLALRQKVPFPLDKAKSSP